MILYMNRYFLKPGTREALVKELNDSGVEAMFRAMPGNIKFDFSIPVNEDNLLYMNDLWATQETFEAHLHCEAVDIWHEIKDRYVIDKDSRRYDIP
ncbi:MAG: antibiotic biosynthesis monooxygenase [Lachnospiraceae bacterium]|nr:antibiotic biosynthesis monooxygenase [Lachnospiraceae bacterium]